jgi:hypothetical protein
LPGKQSGNRTRGKAEYPRKDKEKEKEIEEEKRLKKRKVRFLVRAAHEFLNARALLHARERTHKQDYTTP